MNGWGPILPKLFRTWQSKCHIPFTLLILCVSRGSQDQASTISRASLRSLLIPIATSPSALPRSSLTLRYKAFSQLGAWYTCICMPSHKQNSRSASSLRLHAATRCELVDLFFWLRAANYTNPALQVPCIPLPVCAWCVVEPFFGFF